MRRRAQALEPFERDSGENPYAVQSALQDTMQDLVGIVRQEPEMEKALEEIVELKQRANAPGSLAIANTTPDGTRRSICTTC